MRVYQFRHIRADAQCSRAVVLGPAGHAANGHLDRRWSDRQHEGVNEAFDERDAAAVLAGILEVNAKLADIGVDLLAIRMLMENGDEEEEDTEDEEP